MFSTLLISAIKTNNPAFVREQLTLMQAQLNLISRMGGGGDIKPEYTVDGVDPNTGHTPLIAAVLTAETEIIRLLLTQGKANRRAQDAKGRTAFFVAAEQGSTKILRQLLEGTDFSALDVATETKETPLIAAARHGHQQLVKEFIEAKEIGVHQLRAADSTACTIASWSVYHGHLDNLKLLATKAPEMLDEKHADGDGLLHIAARQGHLAVVEYLVLEAKADASVRNNKGETAAWLVVKNFASETQIIEALKILTRNQPLNLEARDDRRKVGTLLMQAASRGHFTVVNHLLASGAKIETHNADHQDALYYAVAAGHYQIAAKILALAATDAASLINRNKCLSQAVQNGHLEMVKLLCVFGATVCDHRPPLLCLVGAAKWQDKTQAEIVSTQVAIAGLLLQQASSLRSTLLEEKDSDDYEATPFIVAAKNDAFALVGFYLTMGANVNAADAYSTTALSHAVKKGYTDTVKAILLHTRVSILDIKSRVKWNVFHSIVYAAVTNQYHQIATLLLASGFNPNDSDDDDDYLLSPLEKAIETPDIPMLQILLQPNISRPLAIVTIKAAFHREMSRGTPRLEVIKELLAVERVAWAQDKDFLAFTQKPNDLRPDPIPNTVLDAIRNCVKAPLKVSANNPPLPVPTNQPVATNTVVENFSDVGMELTLTKKMAESGLEIEIQQAIQISNVKQFKALLHLEEKTKSNIAGNDQGKQKCFSELTPKTQADCLVFATQNGCLEPLYSQVQSQQAFMGLLLIGKTNKLIELVAVKQPAMVEPMLSRAPFTHLYNSKGERRHIECKGNSSLPALIEAHEKQATLLDYLWFVQQTLDSGHTCKHQEDAIKILVALQENKFRDAAIIMLRVMKNPATEAIGRAILCWFFQITSHEIGAKEIPVYNERYTQQVVRNLAVEYARIKVFIDRHFSWAPKAQCTTANTTEAAKEVKSAPTSYYGVMSVMSKSTARQEKNSLIIDLLFTAVNSKNSAKLLEVLQTMATLKEQKATEDTLQASQKDRTALMRAIEVGFLDGVVMLLDAGAWPWVKLKPDGENALLIAADYGNPEILQALLNTNNVDVTHPSNESVLYRVIHSNKESTLVQRQYCVSWLLAEKVNVNWQDPVTGDTALIAAVKKGFADIFEQLLAAGAHAYVVNRAGESAIGILKSAATHGDAARRMLQYFSATQRDAKQDSDPENQTNTTAASTMLGDFPKEGQCTYYPRRSASSAVSTVSTVAVPAVIRMPYL